MGIPIVLPAGIDIYMGGVLVVTGGFTLPDNAVSNAKVVAGAEIDAAKLMHQHQKEKVLSNHATSVVAQRVGIHKAVGVGTIVDFRADVTVAAGAGGVATIDLLKNGVSVLSAPITINDTIATYTAVVAAIASAGYTYGDRFDVEVAGIVGTTAKGVVAYLTTREKAQ